ncbi:hypothetical protein GF382_02415 [Candidatus Falkowbacteria bacterium]|nr:hypothetical protein [Candidatus Falkowbacteria bacterium]
MDKRQVRLASDHDNGSTVDETKKEHPEKPPGFGQESRASKPSSNSRPAGW